jgi:2-polyprenyl-3-methyl-5-hydroxy-6-metoxy-1,4-benzoquinol methylase
MAYHEEVNEALASLIGNPTRVLDVGCGRGLNGKLARDRGAYVVGLETDAEARAVAKQRLDEVLWVDIEDSWEIDDNLDGRSFDLIIFGDVLEHVRDPVRVMLNFVSYLAPGGRVLVSLPNVAAWPVRLDLLRGKFEYVKSGILDETHLRFFTRESAIHLVEKAGLVVEDVALNPMILRPGLGPFCRMVERFTKKPFELRKHPGYAWYLKHVRPIEAAVASLAPGLLSFQTVISARAV